jgi:hypothetical protein
MLSKVKTLEGYKLDSLDGEIGKVKEFYFDDRHWTIRYLNGMAARDEACKSLVQSIAIAALKAKRHRRDQGRRSTGHRGLSDSHRGRDFNLFFIWD